MKKPAVNRKSLFISSVQKELQQETADRIGNTEYQSLLGVAKRTAHRDLMDLSQQSEEKRLLDAMLLAVPK